jgi:hypothetical protein
MPEVFVADGIPKNDFILARILFMPKVFIADGILKNE